MTFNPLYILVHHTVTSDMITVEELRAMHLARGFSNIGYHSYINGEGEEFAGRDKTIEGAHCRHGGFNWKALGTALGGNFEKHMPKAKQYNAAVHSLAMECYDFNIPVENVLGHNETGADTLCPGQYLSMNQLRADVALELPKRKYYTL